MREGNFPRLQPTAQEESMGSLSRARSCFTSRGALAALIAATLAAGSVSAQTSGTGATQPGPQTGRPQSPETAPAAPPAQIPGVVNEGPTREMKLAPDTWFRFAVQIQAWAQAHQDRLTNGSDGIYGYDIFCRRCRFFATGSVVKNVFFNFLFEAGNTGKADPLTGARTPATPQVLDAYGQVKFTDWFWLSAGNILMPLTRNGTQPTTTYLSLDTANVAATPALQGNTFVLRDLGIQANGFFADNHIEYRLGMFQGTRQAASTSSTLTAAGACVAPACTVVGGSGHNAPRFVGSLLLNFWDPEVGYVSGGHYYGTKKVIGLMGNVDYQVLRTDGPPAQGTDKNAYYGFSAAAFINYPLSGAPSRTGGDELAALLQFGYYDGGVRQAATGAITNPGTYSNILKQTNYLAEAAYYNHAGRFSVFGKFEKRQIADDYVAALKAASNQTWIAGGLKYYLAPANLMNLTLQYERINNDDAPSNQQGGTNNVTLAWQTILY
jgi:hypothetical protein